MAWRASGVVDQRRKFVEEFESGDFTMAELCRSYEISRETGYKWIDRMRKEGELGLADRSRAPRSHPNQISTEVERQILLLRGQHKTWGPRKLRHRLQQVHPKTAWPVASTIGVLLKREGLSVPRRVLRKTPPYTQPFQDAVRPNQVWCGDFKGWFLTQDHQRIDPLTISDATSRYLLRCQAVEKTNTVQVKAIYEAAFREYGLPEAMRTDNGPPFASRAIAGLSVLSLYWMKLGIIPERIAPGRPEQNGRHERMHRTLKAETANPPAAHRRAQQALFHRFRAVYNQQRPHEALGMKTPASCYAPSPRPYPSRVPEPQYDTGFEVRRVQASGVFKWRGNEIFISEVLRNEPIGFQLIEDDIWLVYFVTFPIAVFDSYRGEISELPGESTRKHGRK